MSGKPEIIVIDAKKNLEKSNVDNSPSKRRVAAYARVSTDEDEQLTSYENQVNYYSNYIKSRPDWEFVGVYADEGISGLNTKKRTSFKQMVDDALNGKIDLILTKSISRFARNTVDSLVTIRKLKECGIEVYFEKENIYTLDSKGELLITIMSSIAQEESRSISENVTWGVRKNMARGKVKMAYAQFLGYRRGVDGKPEIDPEEAKTVRRIYQLYLDGCTIREISRILKNDGIPTPSGKNCNWNVSTILSILRNEKYKGDALLQKGFTTDFLNKKTKRNEGELPQYYVKNSHPAIIDAETFDLVQEELIKRGPSNRGRHSKSVFDRKVICGDCGRFYGPVLWQSNSNENIYVWRCTHKYDSDHYCETPTIRDGDLCTYFVKALNKILQNKESYISELEQVIENTKPEHIGLIRRYLKNLHNLPDLFDSFSVDAFSNLADHMTIMKDGNVSVRFKDGKEIIVERSTDKNKKERR